MTVPTSPAAYTSEYAVMTAALLDPVGVRLRMNDMDAAVYYRLRCHTARQIDRKRNAETFEKEDPRHFSSEFDRLVLRIRTEAGEVWLYFEKNEVVPGQVESLSGEEVQLALPLAPVLKALPAPTDDVALGEAFDEVKTVEEKPGLRRV